MIKILLNHSNPSVGWFTLGCSVEDRSEDERKNTEKRRSAIFYTEWNKTLDSQAGMLNKILYDKVRI